MSEGEVFEKWHAAEVALLEWGIQAVKSDPEKVHKLSCLVLSYREAVRQKVLLEAGPVIVKEGQQ